MPTPRRPLPPGLSGTPFSVAQGRSLGLGQTRMRGNDLARPFRGIRVGAAVDSARFTGRGNNAALLGAEWKSEPEQDLVDRCAALSVALPDGAFFSHLTAARLWPLPLPRARPDEPLHVSVRRPARPPRRSGFAGHLVTDTLVRVVHRQGFPMADPASIFCQLGGMVPLDELVAAGDALVLTPVFAGSPGERPWLSLPQLAERVQLFHGRGKQSAASALALIRPGAESRPESLLRLAIVAGGMPEPEVNPDVLDARGRFLGRADLLYRRWRVIVEYDGEQHRTSTRQFDRDVVRLEGFTRAGWTVVRIVGRSFWADRAGCRVRGALVDAGWRP